MDKAKIRHPLHEIVPQALVAYAILAELRFANDQRMKQVDIHQQKPLMKELDALRLNYEVEGGRSFANEPTGSVGAELKQHADRHPGRPETAQELGARLEREAMEREAMERAAQDANRDKRLEPTDQGQQLNTKGSANAGQGSARMTVSEARALAEKQAAAAAQQGQQKDDKPVDTGPTVQFGAPGDVQKPAEEAGKTDTKTPDSSNTLKANTPKK
jgi:hypothetical protein